MKRSRIAAIGTALALLAGTAFVGGTYLHGLNAHADAGGTAPDQISVDAISNNHALNVNLPSKAHANGHIQGIPGIDSVANFSGKYHADGFDPSGNANKQWLYNTVGNLPQQGGTTTFRAPVIPVSLDLMDYNGTTVRYHVDANQYVAPTVNSPIFQNSTYSSSSTPTQFTDAIQRAEYASSAKSDWHTMLNPVVESGMTMKVPRGYYRFALNPDGSVRYVLIDYNTFANLLFPAAGASPDMSTIIGAAEVTGAITTKDISTFLFPNTFLYFGNPANCCVLGFHGPDQELGDASNGNLQRNYLINYSSWVSPGIFSGGQDAPQDVTTLSHELSETFNDPFVTSDGAHNVTPWWQSSFNCQDNLETGDVIEGLPGDNHLITMNNTTYHVQNEALLQWFEGMTPSDATGGAYSYPDASVLPTANPANTPFNCGQ